MSRERQPGDGPPESVISIIGPGMTVIGDISTDGTIRIEGRVEGNVQAGKAVVVGKNGSVDGTVVTQDAVICGRISGMLTAESRLEVQSASHIEGEVHALRLQLEEGAVLNGAVHMVQPHPPEEPPTRSTPGATPAGD